MSAGPAAPPVSDAPVAADAPRRRWTHPVVLVGALLVLVSVAGKAWVLRQAYFVEDDFLFASEAAGSAFQWDHLTRVHKGHLMPGAFALVWVQTRLAALHWGLAAGTMLALQAAASGLFLRLLTAAFGLRWGVLVPLAVYVAAPLTVPVLSWWSAALNAVPLQLALVLALLALLRYLRTGVFRYAWLTAAAVALGMAFSVKGMFLPPLLFVLAAAYAQRGRWYRAIGAELRARPRLWLLLSGLTAGHLALYLARQHTAEGQGAGLPEPGAVGEITSLLLGRTFPTGVLGGPLTWGPVTPSGGLANPPELAVAGAWAVLAVLVALSLWHRPRAWRAWGILAGYLIVADLVPLLLARGRYFGLVGAEPRYVADAALVFAVCLALAYLPLRGAGDPPRRPWPHRAIAAPAAALFTLGYLAAATVSIHGYAATLSGDRVRAYVAEARAALAELPDDAGVFALPVPEHVVLSWNGPRALSSYVLPPLADDPETAARLRQPAQTGRPLVFDPEGRLVPAELTGVSARPEDGERCLRPVDGLISLEAPSYGGPAVAAAIRYRAPEDAWVNLGYGDQWQAVGLAADDDGEWFVPVALPGGQVVVDVGGLGTDELCVRELAFGGFTPAE
ncbi:hypothetical protein [Allonocardiopsis opalescens]|uniref:4-amino-4-deoxy-L-arabinose transferase-like glycosyltransferase n=1 Tax=Allonocardiopsis opalescens TaxID=1144618 RepID=A0A2T0QCF6_9ACTN|nr:hypothetical protein [Allonocardiopsis opalescens]PRY01592.1 hypothetical protein CLV72_101175 [Allonocardiopsis opalescens]